ncbi:MAG: hypothetical protein AB1780_12055, partial [Pseudomonadota bacterium]
LNSENNDVIIEISAIMINKVIGNAITIIPAIMSALLIFSFMYDLVVLTPATNASNVLRVERPKGAFLMALVSCILGLTPNTN